MSSLKSGLFAFALASVLGTIAAIGCSADGSGDDFTDQSQTPTEPGSGDDAARLPPSSSGDNGVPDGAGAPDAKNDAAKPDATVDAGLPPPVPGTSCTDVTVTAKKPCGACGIAEALCQDDGTGATTWTEYGACTNQLPGGCTPGDVVEEDCGNCGKVTKTCSKYCAFASSVCAGQPPNNCKPGTLQYTTASCPDPSTFKNRTCAETCTWGPYSGSCQRPTNDYVLDLPTAVGTTSALGFTLSAGKMGSRISPYTPCPQVVAPAAGNYPYQFIELHNPNAHSATVTVYTSALPGGVVIDTIMAGYSSPIEPIGDDAKKACSFGPNDASFSDTALTGDGKFSIIKGVFVPAGASVLFYVSTLYQNQNGGPTNPTTGDIRLNVRLDSL